METARQLGVTGGHKNFYDVGFLPLRNLLSCQREKIGATKLTRGKN